MPATSFKTASVNFEFACGIRLDDTLACWGRNEHGQASPPTGAFRVVGLGLGWGCGLRLAGDLECWGHMPAGWVPPPATILGSLSMDSTYGCGLTGAEELLCWGGPIVFSSLPAGIKLAAVATGTHDIYGMRSEESALLCWTSDPHPPREVLAGERFLQISAAYFYGCGVRTDGVLRCWGGEEVPIDPETPPASRAQPPPGDGFVKVACAFAHACALHNTGRVVCWGDNRHGQLKVPDPEDER